MRFALDSEDVAFADVVLIGRIVRYEAADYARFAVRVDKVLKGVAPRRIEAVWDNATFGVPSTLAEGAYLIALRNPSSGNTAFEDPGLGLPVVLQRSCSDAFILPAEGRYARQVRLSLETIGH